MTFKRYFIKVRHAISGLIVRFLRSRYSLLKPIVDYVLAFVGLALALPVLIVTGIIIKVTSSGPVFYTQVRVGRNGRLFNIIKLRTMRVDAESQTGPVWAKKVDSRVTAIGKYLRMTHIDELPQLFNVLKGNMSIIGPRPERPYFVNILNREVQGYTSRLSIKPGITGLAQCYCGYDETIRDVKRKVRYDMFYLKKRCWMLDMKILWKTFSLSFVGEKEIMHGKADYVRLKKGRDTKSEQEDILSTLRVGFS